MVNFPVKFEIPHRGLKFLEYYSEHNVYHPGYDLNSGKGDEDEGNPIVFPADGEIVYVAPVIPVPNPFGKTNGGFGNFIITYHPEFGAYARFAHMKTYAKGFNLNEKISADEAAGTVGKTGSAKYAHLHFEMFNREMFEIQNRHSFTFYPSGKSREWVTRYYLDGLAIIQKEMVEDKVETALAWCKKNLPESYWTDATENEAARFRALALRVKAWFV